MLDRIQKTLLVFLFYFVWSAQASVEGLSAGEIIKKSFTTMPDDLVNITLAPVRYPRKTLFFLGTTTGLVLIDRPTTRFVQRNIDPVLDFKVPNLIDSSITQGPDGYTAALIGGWYLGSLSFGHSEGQVAAALAVKSVAYSLLYTQLILKTLTGRNRPTPDLSAPGLAPAPYTKSPYDWGNWHAPTLATRSAASGMPSFHFTVYFAIARSFERVYGNAWIPYSLSALALATNFRSHRHWVSDMVAGAFIGYGIGTVVADDFLGESGESSQARGREWNIWPLVSRDGSYWITAQYFFE